MTWRQWLAARQLLAEEFTFAHRRQVENHELSVEEAAFARAMTTARP